MENLNTVRLVVRRQSAGAQLLVASAGPLGLELAEAASLSERWQSIDFVHDPPPAPPDIEGHQLLGPLSRAATLRGNYSDAIVALDDDNRRVAVTREFLLLEYFVPCVVHPAASIARSARLDFGCIILAQSVVGTTSAIGMAGVIGPASTIGPGCSFGAGVRVGPGAHVGAGARVGNYSRLGAGGVVEEGVTIGSRVRIAAGSVVDRNLPDGVTASGSPARIEP